MMSACADFNEIDDLPAGSAAATPFPPTMPDSRLLFVSADDYWLTLTPNLTIDPACNANLHAIPSKPYAIVRGECKNR
jgi:hypothetical protein